MAEPARVTFRKQISDGNYGSEVAEVSLDLPVAAIGQAEYAAEMLIEARRLVHEELAKSPSGNVRRALEYPKPLTPREERWKQAEESAEIELAAGRRENARQDDDDDAELPY